MTQHELLFLRWSSSPCPPNIQITPPRQEGELCLCVFPHQHQQVEMRRRDGAQVVKLVDPDSWTRAKLDISSSPLCVSLSLRHPQDHPLLLHAHNVFTAVQSLSHQLGDFSFLKLSLSFCLRNALPIVL